MREERGGLDCATAAEKEGQVTGQIEQMGKSLAVLGDAVDCLETRLGDLILTAPLVGAGSCGDKEKRPPLVGLAEALDQYNCTIRRLANQIRGIRDRCEL